MAIIKLFFIFFQVGLLNVLYDAHNKIESLYIHWPFCPYKCHFCPFVALAGQDRHHSEYQRALKAEIESFAHLQKQSIALKTIYIGGGTPSTWPHDLLLDMFDTLRSTFDFSAICEITIEANPGTVTAEHIELWQKIGITRVSVGVQSLNDSVLQDLNRKQSADQVRTLLHQLKGAIHSVSVDMIVGLPGISKEEWKEILLEVVTWPIMHVSLYFLSVHEGTPLYFRVARNQVTLPPDDATVDLYYWSVECLENAGFKQYEVSSFAKEGFESMHNQVYWDRKPFKGFGIGAWSFDGTFRIQNEKNIEKYMKAQEEKKEVVFYKEKLTDKDIRLEKLMLGLRKRAGYSIVEAVKDLTKQEQVIFFEKLAALEEKKIIQINDQQIVLAKTSLALENEVSAYLSI